MLRSVQYDDIEINYILTYKNVKNINMRIRPNGSISVSANQQSPVEKIDAFVIKHGKYIIATRKKFAELEKLAPGKKEYVSGESFKLLGRDMRLQVIEGEKENIKTDGVYLFLTVKDKNDFNRKGTIINNWYKKQCRKVYKEIIALTHIKFKKYGVKMPQMRIMNMKTRWGSCQPKRNMITLNTQLIETPRNCIEYVVLHEFCHFIHPNHSKKYYNFLQMMMPDWKDRKKVLESREYYIGTSLSE